MVFKILAQSALWRLNCTLIVSNLNFSFFGFLHASSCSAPQLSETELEEMALSLLGVFQDKSLPRLTLPELTFSVYSWNKKGRLVLTVCFCRRHLCTVRAALVGLGGAVPAVPML
jgi:hypothetical protein